MQKCDGRSNADHPVTASKKEEEKACGQGHSRQVC